MQHDKSYQMIRGTTAPCKIVKNYQIAFVGKTWRDGCKGGTGSKATAGGELGVGASSPDGGSTDPKVLSNNEAFFLVQL